MNTAIDYIEANLAGEIDFNEAARKACCSTFHFQRVFFAINDITPAEYTRRRRLTLAATDLASGNHKIIDIAMKYGYDSPNAFTRAFRNLHGVTPTAAREPGVTLTAYPRISFHIQLWDEFVKAPDCQKLTALSDGKPGAMTRGAMLGICYGEADAVEFSYGIGVELAEGAPSGDFERIEIPASTWAVFDCTLDNLQDVTKRIFSEWFPSTGYEHDAVPELEVYLPEKPGEEMQCELWMPVVKKN
jgi:AraC family transcriptional regulator